MYADFKTADSRREKKKSAKISGIYPRKSAGKKGEKVCPQIHADLKSADTSREKSN